MAITRLSAQVQRLVMARARGYCEYCRSPERVSPQSFSIEHITPGVRGGDNSPDNLALACQGCNNHKFTRLIVRDPNSGEDTPLFHPRRQRWRDHFAWSDDFCHIIGLTATGRATVVALQLNRPGVVNLRRLLYHGGQHPPLEPDE